MLRIAVNFVTGILLSDRNTTTLTMVDIFSKAVHFILLPKLHSAEYTGDLLVWHVFLLHGFPRDIVSDLGPQFTSQVWRAFYGVLGSWVSLSSGYHSQSRKPDPGDTLQCVTVQHQSSWSSLLPWVEDASNSLVSATTRMSPFMACLGYSNRVGWVGGGGGGSALSNWVTAGVCGNGSVVSSMCSSSQSQRQAWTPLLALHLTIYLPPPLNLIISLPLSTLFSIVVIIKCLPVECMFTN